MNSVRISVNCFGLGDIQHGGSAGGATAGVIAANAPAALLGDTMRAALPMKAIRIAAAILFLLCGLIVGINALRLV